jgi:hypothetical protein
VTRPRALLAAALIALTIGQASARAADPPPCAAKGDTLLHKLIGDWAVRTEFRMPEGTWTPDSGRSSIQYDLDSCAVVERFSGQRLGQPFDILAVMSANGYGKPYQRTWMHSGHGVLALYQGEVRDGVLTLDTTMPLGRETVRLRLVYTSIGPDGFRFESVRSNDGKSWVVTWRAQYRRAEN